ncbi:hypothetical protein [Pararobbsia alpina]|uniref:Uncharacterized protein n=1 Tax=Pararobbsia alpina TaxID=621374 RepID=A0A6S7BLA4_9BURK|nr:hypothetical protein [Pararobbsia alpina]CAB3789974.1 hypothetical protein LMG28138_02885 [Pararobbsia alpina]
MSQWLNSPLAIGVGTRELVIGATTPRWMRQRKLPAPAEPLSVVIPEAQCFTEAGLLDALKLALAGFPVDPGHKRAPKQHACIVLDDFWASHAILRGDFRTLHAPEIEEVVLAHLNDIYGIEAGSVLVRFSVQRDGRAVFASAMSRTLHEGIHDASAEARTRIRGLRLCLPEMLNRANSTIGEGAAMLLFIADTLMQAVLLEQNCWVAYDAQRLFHGDTSDPAIIAARAEQAFERLASRTSGKREDCGIYLYGIEIDPAPFEGRFSTTVRPAQPTHERSDAHRLMKVAQ